MQWHDTQASYGMTTRLLHGLLALLVLSMYVLAWVMNSYADGDPGRGPVVGLHASTGILTLLTALGLLIWRWNQPRPSLAELPPWQRHLARLTHGLLYLCVIVQPVSGIVMTLAGGHALRFYGLLTLASPWSQNKALAGAAAGLHGLLPWLLLLLLGLHIGAALHHYFIMRDRILQRMLGWPQN